MAEQREMPLDGAGLAKPEALPAFATGLLFLAAYALVAVLFGLDGGRALLPTLLLAGVLCALSVVDLRDFRLPDILTIPLIAGGLAVSSWAGFQPWWWSLLSALVGFSLLAALDLAYRHIRGRAGLGLGDAKLLAASGAWLGAEQLPVVLLWATGSAIVCVLLSLVRGRRVSATDRIPFGPFLAFGTWIAWLHAPH